MEIKGKLVKVLPVQTGQGRNGEWKRQEFIIELDGTYPRKACISAWGDKVNVASLVPGTMINVFFDIESREFNEKWYTSLTAWRVDIEAETQQAPAPMPPIEAYRPEMSASPMNDDLPF